MGQAFLLTGQPGVGKTTVIQTVVAHWPARAGGFYTEEVREGKRRTGFRLITLDGQKGMLASVDTPSRYHVGKYGVDLHDLERIGVSALRRAMEQPHISVIVIDEIGKMELFSQAFREAVQAALASPKPILATIMAAPHPWTDAIKARPDVLLVEVTPANRQRLPERIVRWLESEQQDVLFDVKT